MKWAGKSHRTKLENNTHLQLAIYAELLRQRTGVWPALGNYLISQSKLLTRDNFWFKDTPPVKNLTEENTAQLWQRFLETWAWRQTQFADGSFEVVLGPNDDDDPNSVPPESGLELEILNKAYNEYLHLTGWEERA